MPRPSTAARTARSGTLTVTPPVSDIRLVLPFRSNVHGTAAPPGPKRAKFERKFAKSRQCLLLKVKRCAVRRREVCQYPRESDARVSNSRFRKFRVLLTFVAALF